MKISGIIIIGIVTLFNLHLGMAQVKIGENLQTIDDASILELESSNRAFVLTRVTQNEMDAIVPLHGAMVYNTDTQCIYMYNGNQWRNLCNQGISVTTSPIMPTGNQEGDIWIDSTQNAMHIWDGTNFVLIHRNPQSGIGIPTNLTTNSPVAGDIYVDTTSGDLYTYDGINWIVQANGIQATNGITETNTNTIELGGTLIKPTTIVADIINTLAIQGLEVSSDPTSGVIVSDASTGVLGTMPLSSLNQREEILISANHGQNQFSTPLVITDQKKIDVYRNGVRINFTVVGNNLIELDSDATCFQDDEIRIVQFF